MTKVIEVKCDLRWLIRMVATESAMLDVAVQMGLLRLLDTLAARAAAIDDPEAKEVLHLLYMDEK